jgi:hypothetical protein
MTSTDYMEYLDKLQAERKKRDLIDIKIRKFVETSSPLNLSEEKKRVDHWGNQIKSHNEGIDKKIANCQEVIVQARNRILLQEQLIQRYESIIAEAEAVKESKSTRPHYEYLKAVQDFELKKNYKPKELQKLEIDLEVIDKKINSFKNLMNINSDPQPTPHPPTPHTPSNKIEEATEIKIEESNRMAKLDPATGKRPVKRLDTPAPVAPKIEVSLPAEQPKVADPKVADPKVAEPQHFSDNFGNNPKLLLSTKRSVNKN